MQNERLRSVTASSSVGSCGDEVTPELDAGPPIEQVALPVVPGESAGELADRVLEVEHRVVVAVLARLSASMTAATPAPIRARQ